MQSLFSPLRVGGRTLSNRVVLAPVTRLRADKELCPNELHVDFYGSRTSAGLLITESTAISPHAISSRHVPGIFTNNQAAGWAKVVRRVHDTSDSKISCQLWHPGSVAHASMRAHPLAWSAQASVCESASSIVCSAKSETIDGEWEPLTLPSIMTRGDIKRFGKDLQTAGRYALEQANFDFIEIHCGHGYLFDQFFNSSTNTRTDEYGGSVQNRLRFFIESLGPLLDQFGEDKVAIRLSPHDNVHRHFHITDNNPVELYTEQQQYIQSQMKLAYMLFTEPFPEEVPVQQAFPRHFMDMYRGLYTNSPVIGAGGFTPSTAAACLQTPGAYDAVAFGRWFTSNPDLPRRIQHGWPLTPFQRNTFYVQPNTLESDMHRGYTDFLSYEQILALLQIHPDSAHDESYVLQRAKDVGFLLVPQSYLDQSILQQRQK